MILIEKMSIDHIPQICNLERICFSDPWSSLAFQSELHNSLSLWLVAIDDQGSVMGYIGSQTVLDEADMMNLAVYPEHRGQGVASALIQSLCQQLRENGVKLLTLEVRVSNEKAVSLYQKIGFKGVGLRKNYYRHPKEDALILQKEI